MTAHFRRELNLDERAPKNVNRDGFIDLIKRSVTNYLYLGGDAPVEKFRCVTHYDVKQGHWTIEPLARPLTLLSRKHPRFARR